MAGSSPHSFNKTHLQDPNPAPFSSSTPTKPPKIPEFLKQTTIINKLWELIYLLVIGIAVCYGLFSTKLNSVHSSDDLGGAKEAYLSEISHISSIFEDGVQSSYEFDERDSEFGSGFRKSERTKLNQCFIGESMVVINDENYVLKQLSKRRTIKQNLGSKSLDSAAEKSVLQDSSNCGDGIKKGKFRGLVPIKLEEKFKESGSDSDSDSDSNSNSNSNSQTPLNWRSKSMRLEKIADETSNVINPSLGTLDLRSQSVRVSTPSPLKNSSENKESKGEPSFMESKPQEFSTASSSEMNNLSTSKEIIKETAKDSSNSILKPAPIANTYKRGKSVRTKRPKEQIIEAKSETLPNQTYDEIESGSKPETNATNVNLDDYLSDPEPHSGEVDRKADEFIAKFREQIRLQQPASARKLNRSVLQDRFLS
ncbi:hypothetical protein L2E82_15684 [Cichorium intybus]|uniref:Uncharacterized protein n=1 Tax=Cichorium intybus TaxID=13427 RepID=A0ACB9F417_CICIN|nr:hypothetical protein L2E82_15684 [Cichorium intybus]